MFHFNLYVNYMCRAENMITVSWGQSVTTGYKNANLQWANIQISSRYIKLYMCQIWHFYYKMNHKLAMPSH